MRINIFGGPGSGKSTLAATIFSYLKNKHYNVELVQEYIKDWAYEGRSPDVFEQFYIFANQVKRETSLLKNGVEHIVTDSPILLQLPYMAKEGGLTCSCSCVFMCTVVDTQYPDCINIVLDRDGIPYKDFGRYENEEQAKDKDDIIEKYVETYYNSYKKFSPKDVDNILKYVEEKIGAKSGTA